MKSCWLYFFVLIFISNLCISQSQLEFGPKGGLNLTFIKVPEASFGDNIEVKVGYYAGLFVDVPIEGSLSIQPEVLYVGINDFKFINAPIYLKVKASDRFNILIGPSMNYFFDFFSNKFKVRADLSISHQILKALNVHLKFALGFEEVTPNGLFLGMDLRI
ncbi:hypothetical protein C1T31_12215 [Hanstruepera neustonica]|uniref:Outer membrane protein beta-barrel domain-containing protein n=1 Tax=Hanstruepera neustonica TaxID=1445657 RepID=A0A2K1DWE1_9FLAO|nr:outer membrane beta-barrel protein [Hanstruepera neustonica]PNQ72309.1 hypothetical protein C1T31_12215 [Hanstruepera neustonica]